MKPCFAPGTCAQAAHISLAVLTETAVILQHLAGRNPESGLAPATGGMKRYRRRKDF